MQTACPGSGHASDQLLTSQPPSRAGQAVKFSDGRRHERVGARNRDHVCREVIPLVVLYPGSAMTRFSMWPMPSISTRHTSPTWR